MQAFFVKVFWKISLSLNEKNIIVVHCHLSWSAAFLVGDMRLLVITFEVDVLCLMDMTQEPRCFVHILKAWEAKPGHTHKM